MRFSQRIVVFDAGQLIAVGTPDETVRNHAVEKAYLGKLKEQSHLTVLMAE